MVQKKDVMLPSRKVFVRGRKQGITRQCHEAAMSDSEIGSLLGSIQWFGHSFDLFHSPHRT